MPFFTLTFVPFLFLVLVKGKGEGVLKTIAHTSFHNFYIEKDSLISHENPIPAIDLVVYRL